MDANKSIEAAEESLKKFINTGLRKQAGKHAHEDELAAIFSLLKRLGTAVVGLKTMIHNFALTVTIREVTDFHIALNGIITDCRSLFNDPRSSDKIYRSDQFDKMERSLTEQLDILQGKKPPPPDGLLNKAINTTMYYSDPTPNQTIVTNLVKGWIRFGASKVKEVVATSRLLQVTPEPKIEKLFRDWSGVVEARIRSGGYRFETKLGHVKSRLEEIRRAHLIDYVDVIEGETVRLNFWVNEVEDLRKELDSGIRVCSLDFSTLHDPKNILDQLHALDKSLQRQADTLKSKIIIRRA